MMSNISYAFQQNPGLFIFFVGLFSLLIGSFLNVVIARLPISLKQSWRKDCYEFLELMMPSNEQSTLTYKVNLLLPRSHCPKCRNTLRTIDNIPVISYLFLRGKCHFCQQKISLQYPIVESLTAIMGVCIAYKFGFSWQTLAGCLLTYTLIAQSGIDLEHKLIPDEITLPCLWLGMFCSLFNIFCSPQQAILGAISGYMLLWIVYWTFFLATKKEGMGFGDFKLLAMIAAWLGWENLPLILIISSVVGSSVGITLLLFTKHDRNTRIPFGPFLASAGWIALLWGPEINNWYLNYIGVWK